MEMPALFTSTSMGPWLATMFSTTPCTRSSLRTSRAHAAARPPASRISCATAAAPGSVTSVTATNAPSSANTWAVARPIPLAAPVTSATLPATDRLLVDSRGLTSPDSTRAAIRAQRHVPRVLVLGLVVAFDHEVRAADRPGQLRFLSRELEGAELGWDLHPFGELEPDRSLLGFVEQHVDRQSALVEHVRP